MYLPNELYDAKVLITVKTYPLPSSDYGEVVCTAGLLDGSKWVRIYPILFSKYSKDEKFPKYSWIKVNLVKHPSDDRLESYMPKLGVDEPLHFLDRIQTDDAWAARKDYILKEVFVSIKDLIHLSQSENRSLGTLKPLEILDFIIEDSDREWKPQWANRLRQMKMFDPTLPGAARNQLPIRKVPFTFKYRFITQGDARPRELSIHDWEIGMLYWECLRRTDGG